MDPILFDSVPKSRLKRFQSAIKSLSGLVAYYPLNELDGVTAYNRAPATVGTLNGTITSATLGQTGKIGKAYSFDGINDKVAVASATPLVFNNTVSLVAIINPTGYGGGSNGRVISKRIAGGNGYSIYVNQTNANISSLLGTTIYSSNNDVISLGSWQMIGITWDKGLSSNQITFYNNGVAVGNETKTVAMATDISDLTIGDIGDASRVFNGKIQHAVVVNGTLSAAKMLKLAQIAGLA